jgi:hypothetical protein
LNAFRLDFFWHTRVIHSCLEDFEAKASIDLNTYSLEIVARNRNYRFHPRFHARYGERSAYVSLPDEHVVAFNGWLPYFNKHWPIAQAKLDFKEFCRQRGLRTPRMWQRAEPDLRDFIVKNERSSFGEGLRGPFSRHDPADPQQQLGVRDYYEQFVRGTIVKAWYWEDRLAALELYAMPAVTGDGASTLRTLIQRACRNGRIPQWDKYEAVVRYEGRSLEDVPAEGESVLADYRYFSYLLQSFSDTSSSLERYKDSPVLAQLAEFGPTLWGGVPEDLRPATLYTVDAIADADDKVWLLEMNCNPATHPEAYPLMFERLFGGRRSAGIQAQQPAPPPASALPPPRTMPRDPAPWAGKSPIRVAGVFGIS